MWGTLSGFAAAAAEQVQREARSIVHDVGEVTKQGFDLLDQLDRTLDDVESPEEVQSLEGSEAPEYDRYANGDGGPEKAKDSIENDDTDQSFGTAETAKKSGNPHPFQDGVSSHGEELTRVKEALGCAEADSLDVVLEASKNIVTERKQMASRIKKLNAELTGLKEEHLIATEDLRQQLSAQIELCAELREESETSKREAQEASQQINHLLESQQRWELDNEELRRQLGAAEQKMFEFSLASSVEEEQGRVSRELAEMRDRVDGLLMELKQSEKSIAEGKSRENSLQSELERTTEELEMARASLREADCKCENLSAELDAVIDKDVASKRSFEDTRLRMQEQLEKALETVDAMTAESMELHKQVQDQALQLVGAEARVTEAAGSKKLAKELKKRAEDLELELDVFKKRTKDLEAQLSEKSNVLEKLNHDNQALKAKLVVLKEHEKSLVKSFTDEVDSLKEKNVLSLQETQSLRDEFDKLVEDKQKREALYMQTVKSLDEALVQIHELSIASHRHGVSEAPTLPDLLLPSVGDSLQVPCTPSSQRSDNCNDSIISPDESSFMTPAGPPRTLTGGRSTKNKSKTEMAKEIQFLNKQLKDLKSIQGSMTSEFQQSMSQLNEEIANSVLTAAAVATGNLVGISSPSRNAERGMQERQLKASEVKSTSNDIEQMRNRLEAQANELSALTATNIELETEMLACRERCAFLEKEFNLNTSELELERASVSSLSSQLKACTENLAETQSKCKELQTEKLSDSGKLLQLQDEINTLERNMDGKLAVISILEGVNKNLEDEVIRLRDSGVEFIRDEYIAKNIFTALQEQNASLGARNILLEADCVGLRESVGRIKNEADRSVHNLSTDIQLKMKYINALEAEREELRGAIAALREELGSVAQAETENIDSLAATIVCLETERDHVTTICDSRQSEIQFLNEFSDKRVSDLRKVIEQLESDLDGSRAAVSVLESDITSLRSDLTSTSATASKVEEMTTALASLEKERDILKLELSDKNVQLDKMTEKLANQVNCSMRELADSIASRELIENRLMSELSLLREKNSLGEKTIADLNTQLTSFLAELLKGEKALERSEEDRKIIETKLLAQIKITEDLRQKCEAMDSELTRRVVDDASMRERNRELETSHSELNKELSNLRKQFSLELAAHESSNRGIISELTEIRSREQMGLEIIAAQKESIASFTEKISGLESEKTLLLKRIQDLEKDARDLSSISQELVLANTKLAKIDEKKKREFENLKKQNELISRLQRDKEVASRLHDAAISELQRQLDNLQSGLDSLRAELRDRNDAYNELEDRYNILLENQKSESTVVTKMSQPVRLNCLRCPELESAILDCEIEHKNEIAALTKQLESMSKERDDALSLSDSLQSGVLAEYKAKLFDYEKDLNGLRRALSHKDDEIQTLEKDMSKSRSLIKEKDLMISGKDTELSRMRDEIASLVCRENNEKPIPSTPINTTLPLDIESSGNSGGINMGANTRLSARKQFAAGGVVDDFSMGPFDSHTELSDHKGKDDLDGVSPWILAVWQHLRPFIGTKPPTRKLLTTIIMS